MSDTSCPACGRTTQRGTRPLTLAYKGESITVDMPGWYCAGCSEGVHDQADMKVSDRALNRLKAQAEGLLVPEEVRRIRRRLGLTQRHAGELIGGGPRAFQKYESGDLLPSRSITSSLLLLDHDPGALAVLRERPARVAAGVKASQPSLP